MRRPVILICALTLLFASSAVITLSKRQSGNIMISVIPDTRQFFDEAVPVAVYMVTSKGEKGQEHKIKEGVLDNKSFKNVEEVTLRWSVTTMEDTKTILLQGVMETIKVKELKKNFPAKKRQTLPFSLSTTSLLQSLRPRLPPDAKLLVTIGVKSVIFEDGSKWTESEADDSQKKSHASRPQTSTCNHTVCYLQVDSNNNVTGLLICDLHSDPYAQMQCDYFGEYCNNHPCANSPYPDRDGDSYGTDVDCNDNPGAGFFQNPGRQEICDDGFDNDCRDGADCQDPICSLDDACKPQQNPCIEMLG